MNQTSEACKKHTLNFTLSPEQLKELEPLIQSSGKVTFTDGNLHDKQMCISYIACNGTADVGRRLTAARAGLNPAQH